MYLKRAFSISPQPTFDNRFENGELEIQEEKVYNALEPDYLEFIPASLLRRMGKAVRMGIGAGLPLLKENKKVEGIIIGTANGGLENCINFLNQIVEYAEGRLTPTNFVQSTPNAIAGQLALMDENTGYNVTHVNGSLSFENALIDGMMYLESCNKPTDLLIGAVEEISDYNYNIDTLAGRYKSEIVSNDKLLQTKTEGSVCGEGSSMFICSNDPDNAVVEILEVEQLTYPKEKDVVLRIDQMLAKNNLNREDIDLTILGYNGDIRTDHWYDHIKDEILPKAKTLTFKNFVGEYRTASSFAVYLAYRIFEGKGKYLVEQSVHAPRLVLIYNQFDAVRHSLTLLKKVG
jgi:hypothetical protein